MKMGSASEQFHLGCQKHAQVCHVYTLILPDVKAVLIVVVIMVLITTIRRRTMKSEHTCFICSLKHHRLGYVRCIKITIFFFLSLGFEEDGV
jgi:hypothetical protein